MKLSRKLMLGLLTAALAVSMLTACSETSTPSTPSTPSNPGTSQGGGTGETPENPGGTEQPGGDTEEPDKNPDETPAQKTWANSLAKAYLDQQGVTETDYHVYGNSMIVYSDLDDTPLDGSLSDYHTFAVFGNKKLMMLQSGDAGFYTDGTAYYAVDYLWTGEDYKNEWRRVTWQEMDLLGEYYCIDDVKLYLDLGNMLAPVPTVSEIVGFSSETTTEGTTETLQLEHKSTGGYEVSAEYSYEYEFDTEGALKQVTTVVILSVKMGTRSTEAKIKQVMHTPEIFPGRQSTAFPTKFGDKEHGWKESTDDQDLPETWADSKTKAYLTQNGITKEHFYVKVCDWWESKIYICEVSDNSKSVMIQNTSDGLISGYSYTNGVYACYEGTTASTTERVLTDTTEIAAAQKFFEEIEAYIAIPSDVEVAAFRAYKKGNGSGDEKFITTDGKQYTVWLDDDDSIGSVSVALPNGDSAWVDVEEFKRTSSGTTAMFDMWTMLLNLF